MAGPFPRPALSRWPLQTQGWHTWRVDPRLAHVESGSLVFRQRKKPRAGGQGHTDTRTGLSGPPIRTSFCTFTVFLEELWLTHRAHLRFRYKYSKLTKLGCGYYTAPQGQSLITLLLPPNQRRSTLKREPSVHCMKCVTNE